MSYLICLVLSSLAARGPIVPNPLVTACEVMFPNGTFNLNFTAGQVEAMPINVDLEPLWEEVPEAFSEPEELREDLPEGMSNAETSREEVSDEWLPYSGSGDKVVVLNKIVAVCMSLVVGRLGR